LDIPRFYGVGLRPTLFNSLSFLPTGFGYVESIFQSFIFHRQISTGRKIATHQFS